MTGDPTTLTTSGQRSRHLRPSYSINNDATTLHPVIEDLCTIQKSICECCGRIEHNSDAWIVRGTRFLPPSLRRKTNQFNALMVMNQMNHQYNGIFNLHKLISNPGPLLPKPTLWFKLSWGDLIIIPYIMVMLKLPLHSFQLSLTMNQFQIQTPLQLNQFIIVNLIISWNSCIHNIMKIFWVLTSGCFKLDWWSPLLQNFIQYLLRCFIKMEERMLQSQNACHTFLCLSQPRAL